MQACWDSSYVLSFIPKKSLSHPVLGCEFTVSIFSKILNRHNAFSSFCNMYKPNIWQSTNGVQSARTKEDKLTARISFASLRLSGSESASTSLYRVFSRTLLPLNFFPSKCPSSKAWWSCVQAAHIASMSSSVRAKRMRFQICQTHIP